MIQKNMSSGDLIADRRADYARGLAAEHEFVAAADLMRQALEIAPDWAAGWFSLAAYLEKAGEGEGASEALRTVLRLTDEDVFGAGMKLAALGRASVPAAPPSAFVERLFDDYAERFDKALVERLGYSVPERLADIIASTSPNAGFAHAVDLGCGTGLMGERLRTRVSYLEGFDLSTGMLAKAQEKGIYDNLATFDLSLPSEDKCLPLGGNGKADLVTAADVLTYLGDLDTAFATASAILAPGGLFAFSVEKAPADCDWMLRPSLRYAHGEAYIKRLARGHALAVVSSTEAELRKDGTEDVIGLLFLLERDRWAGADMIATEEFSSRLERIARRRVPSD